MSTYERFEGYEEIYSTPDRRHPFPPGIGRLFEEHLQGRLFDIGCADGVKLAHMIERSGKLDAVLGIEPTAALATRAEALHAGNEAVTIRHAALDDAEGAGAERGSFDCITTLEVIEHVSNPTAFFADAWSYLKPGGWLICSTPNRPVYGFHCRVSGERRDPTHLNEMNWREFRALLAGFTDEVSFHGFWPVMFLFRRWPGLDWLNRLPGARVCSRTMYCAARKPDDT